MAIEMKKRDMLKDVVLDTRSARPAPALSPGVRDALARGLRQAYGPMLDDPIPERFAQLLADLAGSESKS